MPLAQTPSEKKRLRGAVEFLLQRFQSFARQYAAGGGPTATPVPRTILAEFPGDMLTDAEYADFQTAIERWNEVSHGKPAIAHKRTLTIIAFCEKILKQSKRPIRPKAHTNRPSIRVSRDESTVRVDGVLHRLSGSQDGRFVRALLKKRGKCIKADLLSSAIGMRADRIYKQLPKPVQRLILNPKGKGDRRGYCIP